MSSRRISDRFKKTVQQFSFDEFDMNLTIPRKARAAGPGLPEVPGLSATPASDNNTPLATATPPRRGLFSLFRSQPRTAAVAAKPVEQQHPVPEIAPDPIPMANTEAANGDGTQLSQEFSLAKDVDSFLQSAAALQAKAASAAVPMEEEEAPGMQREDHVEQQQQEEEATPATMEPLTPPAPVDDDGHETEDELMVPAPATAPIPAADVPPPPADLDSKHSEVPEQKSDSGKDEKKPQKKKKTSKPREKKKQKRAEKEALIPTKPRKKAKKGESKSADEVSGARRHRVNAESKLRILSGWMLCRNINRGGVNRLKQKAGVMRMSKNTRDVTRVIMYSVLKRYVDQTVLYTRHAGRKKMTGEDVAMALGTNGRGVYLCE